MIDRKARDKAAEHIRRFIMSIPSHTSSILVVWEVVMGMEFVLIRLIGHKVMVNDAVY